LEAEKLKKIKRTGWLERGVKNPETIAQHSFRVALLNWFLSEKSSPRFNIERIIKTSLVHDLSEAYIGDITPYWGLLPKDPLKRKEVLKRWVRLTKEKKEKRAEEKFQREKKALEKLVKFLPLSLQKEIEGAWLDYEGLTPSEGRFTRQGDKAETLLQALEYFGSKPDSLATAWWEEVEDLIDHPALSNFLVEIEKKFYAKKRTDPILDFLIEVGKLKRLPRRGWVVRRIKEPETVADHSFTVALMVWVFGQKKKIDLRKALKMALIHEICAVYAGDYTPHDVFTRRFSGHPLSPNVCYDVLGSRWRWKKFWQARPRLLKQEKVKRFQGTYKKETKALRVLVGRLPQNLKQEILCLWREFNEKESAEGNFVDQVNCLATFLQACQYWQEDKRFPIRVFAEQVAEFISDPELIEFLEALQRKFKLKSLESK